MNNYDIIAEISKDASGLLEETGELKRGKDVIEKAYDEVYGLNRKIFNELELACLNVSALPIPQSHNGMINALVSKIETTETELKNERDKKFNLAAALRERETELAENKKSIDSFLAVKDYLEKACKELGLEIPGTYFELIDAIIHKAKTSNDISNQLAKQRDGWSKSSDNWEKKFNAMQNKYKRLTARINRNPKRTAWKVLEEFRDSEKSRNGEDE